MHIFKVNFFTTQFHSVLIKARDTSEAKDKFWANDYDETKVITENYIERDATDIPEDCGPVEQQLSMFDQLTPYEQSEVDKRMKGDDVCWECGRHNCHEGHY